MGIRSQRKVRKPPWRARSCAGKRRTRGKSARVPANAVLFPVLFSAAWALAVPAYVVWARPWMLTWGAQQAEFDANWPGDELIPQPRHVWTRAVTVDAPPEAVWPWLVQMGQGRGGFYSYDWLENLVGCDIHSLSHIDPDRQQLAVGDPIRLVPEDAAVDLHFLVAQVDPAAALVLVTPGSIDAALTGDLPYLTWGFYLRPTPEGKTRLIARTRAVYRNSLPSLLSNKIMLEPIQFVMERKMLLGIRARAERAWRAQRSPDRDELAVN